MNTEQEAKKRNYKLCRFCRRISRKPDFSCYCEVSGEQLSGQQVREKRAKKGCGFRLAKQDFVSGAPVEMAVLGGRFEKFACWHCGRTFYSKKKDDELYCEWCRSAERKKDNEAISRNLNNNAILGNLINGIVEQSFRDYKSILEKLNKAIEFEYADEQIEELIDKKCKMENYFFSTDFQQYNVTNIDTNKMINMIHKAEGFNEDSISTRKPGKETGEKAD